MLGYIALGRCTSWTSIIEYPDRSSVCTVQTMLWTVILKSILYMIQEFITTIMISMTPGSSILLVLPAMNQCNHARGTVTRCRLLTGMRARRCFIRTLRQERVVPMLDALLAVLGALADRWWGFCAGFGLRSPIAPSKQSFQVSTLR